MTLSHGQSEVERGFSINENALVDNMQMETIIIQRKVNDYKRKNNVEPHNMPMPKVLLQNAKQGHFKYKKALNLNIYDLNMAISPDLNISLDLNS